MGEESATDQVDEPVTVSSIAADLRELGLREGDVVLVHSSLRAIGWVSGGAQAVVEALLEVVTESGTLVMPTHTGQYSDPAHWSNPPVPDEWVETIRETRPPFRPDATPSRGMGAIAECFRTYPGVVRSGHPLASFAAWGAEAEDVVADHRLDEGLGERSPLGRLYECDADVLLLGVDHDVNTSIHLAEYRADLEKTRVTATVPVLDDGRRVTVEYEDIEWISDDFPRLGAAFEREVGLATGSVGAATAKLVSQRALVEFAVDWLEEHR